MATVGSYTVKVLEQDASRSKFAQESLGRLTSHRQHGSLDLQLAEAITRLLCEATGCRQPPSAEIQEALDGEKRICDEAEVAAFVGRLLPRLRGSDRRIPAQPLAWPASADPGLGGIEDKPIWIVLKSARVDLESDIEYSGDPAISDKVMPFNTWQVVKRHMKEKWPDKSLKTIPDSNIRLLHKGIELGNNDMVDDYPMEGGTPQKPVEISYLIVNDRGSREGNIGLYVDPQVQICTSKLLRDKVLHAQTSLRRGIVPQLTLEGTGATYMLRDADNRTIVAVFKPKDEEACAPQNPRGYVGKENSTGFRQGVFSTQQAAREVAAYLLDHEKFAGVPETTLVHAKHPKFVPVKNKEVWKVGAFQLFIETKDSAGNYAAQVFVDADVHRIGILDIRLVNLDRNDGNLLVRHARGTSRYDLIPIDHGLSLPDRLEVYYDDLAWMSWPQAHKPFGEKELAYIKKLNGPKDAKLLDKYLGIRRECTRLMEMTTLLVQIGAELGLTLFEIGSLLYRVDSGSDSPVQRSPFEVIIEKCLDMALISVGEGTTSSALLAGLDLQRSRVTAPVQKPRSPRPTGNEGDLIASPVQSPMISSSFNSHDDRPPQLSLDSNAAEHSSDDYAPQSPKIALSSSKQRCEATLDVQVLDAPSKSMPRGSQRKSYRVGTSTSKRSKRTSKRASVFTEIEPTLNSRRGQIFSRPEVRANDWSPELEKLFKDKVDSELRRYITKKFERVEAIANPDEDDAKVLNGAVTTIKGHHAKGSNRLVVADASKFKLNQKIVIARGSPIEEGNEIVGFGSFHLKAELKNDHADGTTVQAEDSAMAPSSQQDDDDDDDTSLASAFSVRPSDVESLRTPAAKPAQCKTVVTPPKAPRYVPPMMRNKSKEERHMDVADDVAQLPTVLEDPTEEKQPTQHEANPVIASGEAQDSTHGSLSNNFQIETDNHDLSRCLTSSSTSSGPGLTHRSWSRDLEPETENSELSRYGTASLTASAETDNSGLSRCGTASSAASEPSSDAPSDFALLTKSSSSAGPKRYVPPHMRRKQEEAASLAAVPERTVLPAPSQAAPGVECSEPTAESQTASQKYIPPQACGAAVRQSSPSSTVGLPTEASGGTARYGYSVNQGPRPSMEDAVDVVTGCDSDVGDITTEIYAVYDGHSGTAAVEFVKTRLPQVIREHDGFKDPDRMRDVLHDAFTRTDCELLDHLRQQQPPPLPATAQSDEDACSARNSGSYMLSSGCVATVVVIRGNRIHISNLGDCRALICRNGEMIPLTVDHHPCENEVEVERLRTLGVEVSCDGYLHGRIGVSRAFGDWAWHAREKCLGLICEPDIYEAEITEDVEFMLLACDGIFEKMTSKEAGQIVRRRLRATRDAKASAEALVKNASKMNGTDNLSAIIVVFTLPPSNDGERVAPRLNLFKAKAAPATDAGIDADGAALVS